MTMPFPIVGRERELAAVTGFVDDAGPRPPALVLVGDPGIGKSTLWQAGVARARARELRVLSARPAQAEQGLAHPALGDLLEDAVAEVAPRLALPRRRALEIALLLTPPGEQALDPRTLGVAVRDALELLAAERPVLLAIDDQHWLDAASAGALRFAL